MTQLKPEKHPRGRKALRALKVIGLVLLTLWVLFTLLLIRFEAGEAAKEYHSAYYPGAVASLYTFIRCGCVSVAVWLVALWYGVLRQRVAFAGRVLVPTRVYAVLGIALAILLVFFAHATISAWNELQNVSPDDVADGCIIHYAKSLTWLTAFAVLEALCALRLITRRRMAVSK